MPAHPVTRPPNATPTEVLVADLLAWKIRLQSRALARAIADQLEEDPRLAPALARLRAVQEDD
jgi:hypothetical protein